MAHPSTPRRGRYPLTTLAQNSTISLRTLQRWHQAYKNRWDRCLGSTNVKRRRYAAYPPRSSKIHRTTLIHPPAPQHRHLTLPGNERSNADGPDAAHRDKHELIYRYSADRPNATWQADHTELDILIVDGNGRPERPWLTTVFDDCSRAGSEDLLRTSPDRA